MPSDIQNHGLGIKSIHLARQCDECHILSKLRVSPDIQSHGLGIKIIHLATQCDECHSDDFELRQG